MPGSTWVYRGAWPSGGGKGWLCAVQLTKYEDNIFIYLLLILGLIRRKVFITLQCNNVMNSGSKMIKAGICWWCFQSDWPLCATTSAPSSPVLWNGSGRNILRPPTYLQAAINYWGELLLLPHLILIIAMPRVCHFVSGTGCKFVVGI